MPYAAKDQVSKSPIDGGIPINDAQYREALDGMAQGKVVRIDNGFEIKDKPQPTTYWLAANDRRQTEPGEDVPAEGTTEPPPAPYYVIENGEWVEDADAKAKWFMEAIQSRADQELQRGVSVTIDGTTYGTTYGIRTGPQALALIDGAAIRADVAARNNESVSRRVPTDQGTVSFDGPALWSIFESVESHQQAVAARAEALEAMVADGTITEDDLEEGWTS